MMNTLEVVESIRWSIKKIYSSTVYCILNFGHSNYIFRQLHYTVCGWWEAISVTNVSIGVSKYSITMSGSVFQFERKQILNYCFCKACQFSVKSLSLNFTGVILLVVNRGGNNNILLKSTKGAETEKSFIQDTSHRQKPRKFTDLSWLLTHRAPNKTTILLQTTF